MTDLYVEKLEKVTWDFQVAHARMESAQHDFVRENNIGTWIGKGRYQTIVVKDGLLFRPKDLVELRCPAMENRSPYHFLLPLEHNFVILTANYNFVPAYSACGNPVAHKFHKLVLEILKTKEMPTKPDDWKEHEWEMFLKLKPFNQSEMHLV